MTLDWLSTEAKSIHNIFSGMFYSLVLMELVLGVVLGYLKMSLGDSPELMKLVTRSVYAALLLVAFPEIMNFIADMTDSICERLGDLNNFKLVLDRMTEKLDQLTWSWVSVKDSLVLVVSFLSFFVLYITVYLADSIFVYSWLMLFVFSPVMIALYVLPQTASATSALFKAMLHVSAWKIVWSVTAALLWSFALSQVNSDKADIDFLTVILVNLMLAMSVLLTPKIVSGLFSGGVHTAGTAMGGMIAGASGFTAAKYLSKVKSGLTPEGKQAPSEESDKVNRYKPNN